MMTACNNQNAITNGSATYKTVAFIPTRTGAYDIVIADVADKTKDSAIVNAHSENAPSGTSRSTSVNFVMPRTLNVGLKFGSTN